MKRNIIVRRTVGILTFLIYVVGIPSFLEDVSTWHKWLDGDMIEFDIEDYRWLFLSAAVLLFLPEIWKKLKAFVHTLTSATYTNKRLTTENLKFRKRHNLLLEMAKDLLWVYGSLGTIESYTSRDILNEDDVNRRVNLSQEKMFGIRKHINILLSRYACSISESGYQFVPYTGVVFNERHRKEIEAMQEPKYQLQKLENHLSARIVQTENIV